MHSRASQVLATAFRQRGVQRDLAKRTGISQASLSRLAKGVGSEPKLGTSELLKNDPVVPIDPSWWRQPPLPETASAKGAA
jgi:transcriptional regulator with XRE-family HTH domain